MQNANQTVVEALQDDFIFFQVIFMNINEPHDYLQRRAQTFSIEIAEILFMAIFYLFLCFAFKRHNKENQLAD